MQRLRVLCAASLLATTAGCDAGGLPEGWKQTPAGSGPSIRWELEAEPLPDIPFPNDVATWPDPTSPTGRRINASLVAPTGMERRLRNNFDRLDGWATFGPVTVAFDRPLDTDDMIARQGRGRFSERDFQRHAVYLIDLDSGIPVPLDVNTNRQPPLAARPSGYWSNDYRSGQSNVIFETVDEDTNDNGRLDPGEDTDFDGVLDVPNTLDGELQGTPLETYDRMLWFYERETDTLILRPIVPLEETHEYAVVVTDRLMGAEGHPVRSPFEQVHHHSQREALAPLEGIFEAHPHIYGDLATRGWDGVAFAWTFTTQSVTGDLRALRDGLYGRGPFARLAEQFPARMVPARLRGGRRCDPRGNVFTTTPAELREALQDVPLSGFGVPPEQLESVLESLEQSVSHFVIGFYESPYLLGDPDAESPNDVWDLDRTTGRARLSSELVPLMITIPKETEAHRQPFPVTLYAHGYGTLKLEQIAFAGAIANHGIASVTIDAQGHGLPVDDSLLPVLRSVLSSSCLEPLGDALLVDRARDLDGDGSPDSAGLFFSAYMFHTRDTLRQTVLDYMQLLRIVRNFQGHPDHPDGRHWQPAELPTGESFDGDLDGDGRPELMGDFDADGTPDLGGWERPYYQWGSSLGGIISMLMAGVEPAVQTAAPVSGGGGLFDIGVRSNLGTVRNPVWLRTMGPLLVSVPSNGPSDFTGCEAGQRSIRFEVPDLDNVARIEVACLSKDELDEGDAVLVRNFGNSERRCAGVGTDGRFRISIPADRGDPLVLEVYRGIAQEVGYGDCTLPEGAEPSEVVEQWRSQNGPNEPGSCARCAQYRTRVFSPGERLVSPVEGLGLPRQTPALRRLADLAPIAIGPADPINYARHVFLDPVTAPDVPERKRSVLVMNTAGDATVPTAGGNAYARAAGVLPFLPPDAPDELADWRAPPRVRDRYGVDTPDDVLLDHHVVEGLPWLDRHPVEGTTSGFAFDVDDLSEGEQYFDASGRRQVNPGREEFFRPHRLDPPLRWARESRPVRGMPGADPWQGKGEHGAFSSLIHAMIVPAGHHVVLPVDPRKRFDEGAYYLNAIGWYLASGGSELLWHTRPDDHHCLESSSCLYGE